MKKRISVLLLTMTMVLATLVGCGSTEETGNQNDNTSTNTNVETNVSDEKETKSSNTSVDTEVETNVPNETDVTESEESKEESSVITFDEMLDSMVAEYGEVEFIPVFAERNFEDTIAYLETELRPTKHTVTSVMVYTSEFVERTYSDGYAERYMLGSGAPLERYKYVPVTYDGEHYYVTYPEMLFDDKYTSFYRLEIPELPYTPGEPSKATTKCTCNNGYEWQLDFGYGCNVVGDEYSYSFGENVYHFMYEGESYIFLYRMLEDGIENPCVGIVLKDTEYTKDKTAISIVQFENIID